MKILFSPNLGTESWVCLQHLAEYCEQTHEAWGFCSSPGHWPLWCQHCEARAIADQLQCLFPWLYVHLSMFLEKGMVTHSSILAWRIPWTEEPAGLQSMQSQRAGHGWTTDALIFFNLYFYFEITLDSHTVTRNNTVYDLLPVFHDGSISLNYSTI